MANPFILGILMANLNTKSLILYKKCNFCEAFRVAKIQAPSTKRKKIAKRKAPLRRPFRPKTIAKPNPPTTTKPKDT